MNKHLTVPLILLIALATNTALAQNTMFLRNSPVAHLDEADREMLSAAIREVIASPDGTTLDWNNPDTGSKGRIKVLDTHEAFDTTCRNLRSRSVARGRQAEGIYRMCKQADGTWRFATTDPDTINPPAKKSD